MTTYSSKTKISRSDLNASIQLVEVKPGKKFSLLRLKEILPDIETLLFFAKVYELNYNQLSHLLQVVKGGDVVTALTEGDHSNELQDYLVDIVPSAVMGGVSFNVTPPHAEILPQVWASLEVTIADSIRTVANKLEGVIGTMPGKTGAMLFNSMMVMNAKRPTLGDYRARIHHAPKPPNLVILDVSGSMSSTTVKQIADEVVALGYAADAALAIVSNSTFYWDPGTYSVQGVLDAAEYGGTQYETLAPVFDKDWGVVITIADYDSSASAMDYLGCNARGSVGEVFDISLVDRPTFLSQCVGQLAQKVTPMLIGNSYRVLNR